MITFQEFLSSKRLGRQFVADALAQCRSYNWLKVRLKWRNPQRNGSTFARALPTESPLATLRCGTCHYFRNDPAWVAGVFSGFPGLGSDYASACAANGFCRPHRRWYSATLSCEELRL